MIRRDAHPPVACDPEADTMSPCCWECENDLSPPYPGGFVIHQAPVPERGSRTPHMVPREKVRPNDCISEGEFVDELRWHSDGRKWVVVSNRRDLDSIRVVSVDDLPAQVVRGLDSPNEWHLRAAQKPT